MYLIDPNSNVIHIAECLTPECGITYEDKDHCFLVDHLDNAIEQCRLSNDLEEPLLCPHCFLFGFFRQAFRDYFAFLPTFEFSSRNGFYFADHARIAVGCRFNSGFVNLDLVAIISNNHYFQSG